MKNLHEIRDPIHVFITLDNDERKVLDSPFFQRLRNIHQLSLTYLLYPGATHKRFEHSLGVMELATRVFDVITTPEFVSSEIGEVIPEISNEKNKRYWRSVLRMAALCHDIGHLPFSHASEALLPENWNHEKLSVEIIRSASMNEIWQSMTPPLRDNDIAKLAVGPKQYREGKFTPWETILSEIIVGDAFGVDRIDYLLRDSHHAGVAYGKFDHYRLIDTLRILPSTPGSREPSLGIEEGGIHSAEALLLARYFMFEQVYLHPVRRIFDIHLADFLHLWLEGGYFPITAQEHLDFDDATVLTGIKDVCKKQNHPAYETAKRLYSRNHFKRVYSLIADDSRLCTSPGKAIKEFLVNRYGENRVKHDRYDKPSRVLDFPVKAENGEIVSASGQSQVLQHIPSTQIDYVFVTPELREEVKNTIIKEKDTIFKKFKEQGEEDE